MRLHEYITVLITYEYHSTNNLSDILNLSNAQQHKIPRCTNYCSPSSTLCAAPQIVVIALVDPSMRAQLL